MNDLAAALILGLARTTALLAVAALAVYGLLRLTRASSPAVHRAAWCLVLLQGWLWFRLPVGIPWYEAVGPALPAESAAAGPTLPVESAAVGPALPAESVGGSPRDPQPGHGVTGLPSAPAESKPATIPAGGAGPTDTASGAGGRAKSGLPRDVLTYDGKRFDVWVSQLESDLSPERRTEAIKALTAFGSHGYGKEAARAIVAAMRDYRFGLVSISRIRSAPARASDPILEMKYAAIEALTTRPGRIDDRPSIAPEDAVPILVKELRDGPPNGRLFAAAVLSRIGEAAKPAIPVLVEVVKNDKDSEVRIGALRAAADLDGSGDTTLSLVVEAAKGNDRRLAAYALRNVAIGVFRQHGISVQDRGPYALGGGPGYGRAGALDGPVPAAAKETPFPDKLKPLMQAVIAAVTDKDPEVSDAAIGVVRDLGPARKAFLPALVQILEGPDREGRAQVLSLLRDVGVEAKVAVPALIRILEKRDPAEDTTVRQAALSALREVGAEGKDTVPALIRVLDSPERVERILATYALGNLGRDAKAALPALEKAEENAQAVDAVQGRGESVNAWALRTAIECIKRELPPGNMPRSPVDTARGSRGTGVTPSGSRGAAKGAAGYSGTKTPPTPAPPSGKPASEEKKTEAPR